MIVWWLMSVIGREHAAGKACGGFASGFTKIMKGRLLGAIIALGSGVAMAGDIGNVKWDASAPSKDIVSSYEPEVEAELLNFYDYSGSSSRRVAQTFSLAVQGEKVALSSLTLKLGRDVVTDGGPYTVTIAFYRIDSPTARDLDPTKGQLAGSSTVKLKPAHHQGEAGSYFTATFAAPIVLEAIPEAPCAYSFVLNFDEPRADQKLILSLGANIAGHRAMQNTDDNGWKYVGENPSLIYYLQGTNRP